jgi:hypothetical protein
MSPSARLPRFAVLLALAAALIPASVAEAAKCPRSVAPPSLLNVKDMRKLTSVEARFGARPTGSESHEAFTGWLERKLKRVRGIKLRSIDYPIERWQARSTELSADGSVLPVAGPIPYSEPTGPGGVTAPLLYRKPGEPITPATAAGKIVAVEDAPITYPYSVFFPGSLGIAGYDPVGLDPAGPYTRESRVEATFLRQAQAAGAAGLIIVKDLPLSDIRGFYRPYSATKWTIPGAFVGADEGVRLEQAATGGGTATLAVDAFFAPGSTRTLLATLPGKRPRASKVVVESHTDGMNPVWDNGPIAMIAMARYLSSLGKACRPRRVQFAFTTGHLYGSIGSEDMAERLDARFDSGSVAGAIALEHLGAREYATVPREDGPGNRLVRTSTHELTLIAVTQSAALRGAVIKAVKRSQLDRSVILVGTDVPVPERVPPNCSFGGEGTAYERLLVPTVGVITGPRILFTPGYGVEAIDFRFMRKQTIAFTNLLMKMSRMSIPAIAGDLIEMRQRRAMGAPGCTGGG